MTTETNPRAVLPAEPLRYAPPPAARRQPVMVIFAGLFTTALALVGLHFIQPHVDQDIMSFTPRFIPIGALIVGLVAGLGYCITAYILNVRVHGWLIWTIVVLLIWSYFAAHYVEFAAQGALIEKQTNKRIGFFRYYHLTTIYMTRTKSSTRYGPKPTTEEREVIGNEGYLYRVLGIAGFVLGGIGIPLALRRLPYCPLCQRYMKTKTLIKLPATAKLPAVRIRGKHQLNTPEHEEQLRHALTVLEHASNALRRGDVQAVRDDMSQHNARVAGRVPVFGIVELVYCRQCFQGTYATHLKNNGNYQTGLSRQLDHGDLEAAIVEPIVNLSKPVPEIAEPASTDETTTTSAT